MSESGKETPREHGPESTRDPILRAKYLDYCSARVAEVLLRLSADEMYVLAQDAARDAGQSDSDRLSYDQIVRLATERISRKLTLPEFEEFEAAFRSDPEQFESELLGLWKSDLEPSDR